MFTGLYWFKTHIFKKKITEAMNTSVIFSARIFALNKQEDKQKTIVCFTVLIFVSKIGFSRLC
ncbi:hypothetical protein SXM_3367 [Shewanella xiamenensis]|nr:hypothetical protein SXM_3367 [Shewanella xiamenensis]ODR85795.1 hypothetical protein ABT47_11040 [Shewanella xiamenensis]